jgi:hypothetical protein
MEEQFDFFRGEAQKVNGMNRAANASHVQEWKGEAWAWFYQLPVGTVFTGDDIRKRIGTPDEGMNRNNVMGAFISGLAAERRIRFTGRTVKSSAVSRHTGTQREWVKVR